jgi:hypothetical protein
MLTRSFFTSESVAGKEKNHIQILWRAQGLAITHEDKEEVIARHFGELLGTKHHRAFSLNWEELNYPSSNLADLEMDIIGEEVKRAIFDTPKENASGPDGFIGDFYSSSWATVQSDGI